MPFPGVHIILRRPTTRLSRASLGLAATFAVVLLLGAPAAGGPAPASPPAEDPDLMAAIQRFDEAQKAIERISARFKEVKTIALLREPIVQSGRFYHTKPDKFLWEYTSPEPKVLVLNAEGIVAYYPAQKRAEEIKTRFGKRIVKYLGLGSMLKDLEDEYEMTLSRENGVPGTDLIVLRPKGRRIQKRLAEIRIWLDGRINQPRQIEYVEADGDRTHMTFDDILLNPDISLSKYQIKIPQDVPVTNTLSGFFGGNSGR